MVQIRQTETLPAWRRISPFSFLFPSLRDSEHTAHNISFEYSFFRLASAIGSADTLHIFSPLEYAE